MHLQYMDPQSVFAPEQIYAFLMSFNINFSSENKAKLQNFATMLEELQ